MDVSSIGIIMPRRWTSPLWQNATCSAVALLADMPLTLDNRSELRQP
jgi:hypothetical protein